MCVCILSLASLACEAGTVRTTSSMTTESTSSREKAVLRALSWMESRHNPSVVGKRGEITQYQIMPSNWKALEKGLGKTIPRSEAPNIALALLKAHAAHFHQKTKRKPQLKDAYVMWNWGPTRYSRVGFDFNRAPRVVRERAIQFTLLVDTNLEPNWQ